MTADGPANDTGPDTGPDTAADTGVGPDLSVVIPAYNAAATITAQLDAVLAQDVGEPFEVVVVDNMSTDATPSIVAERAAHDPRLRLVSATGARGPSHTRNVGVGAARGTRVACCDADDVVAPGWLHALGEALRSHGFVGGRLAFDLLNDETVVAGRGGAARAEPGQMGPVTFAHGCNFAIERGIYLAASGLDEHLIAGEEVDLAIRLAGKGITVTTVPDAVIQYRYRTTRREQWDQSFEGGRVKPFLCRALRQQGFDAPSRLDGLRVYWWLLRTVPRLRDQATRMRWLWVLAQRSGQAAGCLRHRTLYL